MKSSWWPSRSPAGAPTGIGWSTVLTELWNPLQSGTTHRMGPGRRGHPEKRLLSIPLSPQLIFHSGFLAASLNTWHFPSFLPWAHHTAPQLKEAQCCTLTNSGWEADMGKVPPQNRISENVWVSLTQEALNPTKNRTAQGHQTVSGLKPPFHSFH